MIGSQIGARQYGQRVIERFGIVRIRHMTIGFDRLMTDKPRAVGRLGKMRYGCIAVVRVPVAMIE